MNNLVEQLLEKIQDATNRQLTKTIAQLDDKTIYSNSIEGKLRSQFEIQPPVLKTEEMKVAIGREKVAMANFPKGFTPGQKIDFALFTVSTAGSYELFSQLLKTHPWRENFHHEDGQVFYKIVSPVVITGNDQIIKELRKKAETTFLDITGLLDKFGIGAKKFNSTLAEDIARKLGQERANREARMKTETQLNPFV